MPAGNQLQAQFALAQAGFTRQQHAQAEDVHENAMPGNALSKVLGQVAAQHINDVAGRLFGHKQRDARAATHGHELVRGHLPIGHHHQGGSSVTMRWMRRSCTSASTPSKYAASRTPTI
jgi:hypothetical protein